MIASCVFIVFSSAAPLNRVPKKDDMLLALYDGLYYRCKVDEVLDKKVKVTFVDYGDSRVVDVSSCKDPSPEIMQVKCVQVAQLLVEIIFEF